MAKSSSTPGANALSDLRINRSVAGYLTSRYSERKEAAAKLEERVGLKAI
jgi:hypothetical protein